MSSYLIAGASRGIGRELVIQLSQKPETSIVYAGVRSPDTAPSEFASNPKIHILKLDILSQTDVDEAVKSVQKTTGSLDVLIINAGANNNGFILKCSVEELQTMFDVNASAPHRVIQAFLPLIRQGQAKKIIAVGTAGGSFTVAQSFAKKHFPLGAYAVSKASLHFLLMLYAEELVDEGIIAVSIHPGAVATEMAQEVIAREGPGLLEIFQKEGFQVLSATESAEGIIKVAGDLTKEKSGVLLSYDGSILPY